MKIQKKYEKAAEKGSFGVLNRLTGIFFAAGADDGEKDEKWQKMERRMFGNRGF